MSKGNSVKKEERKALHKKEMKNLGSHACAVKSLYNILGGTKSPKEIAEGINFRKGKGAYILDCLFYLQRNGWEKFGVESSNLNGDEIYLYLIDALGTEASEFCVIISYDKHMASFYNGIMVELADDFDKVVLYFFKKSM